jgi:hypothetical protein
VTELNVRFCVQGSKTGPLAHGHFPRPDCFAPITVIQALAFRPRKQTLCWIEAPVCADEAVNSEQGA